MERSQKTRLIIAAASEFVSTQNCDSLEKYHLHELEHALLELGDRDRNGSSSQAIRGLIEERKQNIKEEKADKRYGQTRKYAILSIIISIIAVLISIFK